MATYILPKLGAMPVDTVGTAAIINVLRPLALSGKDATAKFTLARVDGGKTIAAYARDDLLAKRRPVMQAWADTHS